MFLNVYYIYVYIYLSFYIYLHVLVYIYVYSSTVAYGSGTTNWVIVSNPFQPWIMEDSDSCEFVGMIHSEKTGRTSRNLYEFLCGVDLTLQEGSQLVILQPFLKNNNLENTG